MKHPTSRGVALVVAGSLLVPTALSAQAPPQSPAACRSAPGLPADTGIDVLGCLPQSRRVELLTDPVEPTALPPLDRDYRLKSALHQLKAQEAEALAVPDPAAGKALDAYLEGRAIETQRSAALRDATRELARSQSRMVLMSADLAIAATAASDWVRRQPGRNLPAAYRQRVVSAAAAILAEDLHRQRLADACDAVNREFDRKLDRALTLHG